MRILFLLTTIIFLIGLLAVGLRPGSDFRQYAATVLLQKNAASDQVNTSAGGKLHSGSPAGHSDQSKQDKERESDDSEDEEASGGSQVKGYSRSFSPGKILPKIKKQPLDESRLSRDERSAYTLTKLIARAHKNPNSPEAVVTELNDRNLQPTMATESNPYTGAVTFIRTENTLPGVRYFHAQYLSDKPGIENEALLEHMSFELRPSATVFEDARKIVYASFAEADKPEVDEKDFVMWRLNEGRIAWVKRLSLEEMQNNPFNAYDKSDLGTVRIAVELDPHY